MPRLPQLEAQLIAAAGTRRSRMRRRPAVIAAGALAVAALVVVALLLATSAEPQRHERPAAPVPAKVPAATLAKARALAGLPAAKDVELAPSEVPAAARRSMARIPYPPGARDRFNWHRHAPNLHFSSEVERLAEFRSYCLWLRYWLAGADRAGATAVLAEVPRWPGERRSVIQRSIFTALRDGDVRRITREIALSCGPGS
jgi:hypothetical protein